MEDALSSKLVEEARKIEKGRHRPISVYRLQFGRHFTFRDAADLVPYLQDLGITDCYCSPYLKARPGSLHGYDITDHNELNPELGSQEDYDEFVGQLRKHNMGHILDFVPNHMGMFGNPMWHDVLENGPASPYATYFDIDWKPAKAELYGKVLLPILGDLYGKALEEGQLTLQYNHGTFTVQYADHSLQIDPGTIDNILDPTMEVAKSTIGEGSPDYLELQSIITASKNLPKRTDTRPGKLAERRREKEVIKRRLADLTARNSKARRVIEEAVSAFKGIPGDNASFRKLHELLENQAYRLSYWQAASDEVNYRRFFVINELVGLRMEDPAVFEATHQLVRRLIAEGKLDGLRIDHVDGLLDPGCYLWQLQKSCWVDMAVRTLSDKPEFSAIEKESIEDELSRYSEEEVEANPRSEAMKPLFLVVEKILAEGEALPESWPVDGTTGYEFSCLLDRIFVDTGHRRATLDTYRQLTDETERFKDIVYDSKILVLNTSLAAPLTSLAHELNAISETTWQYRDFTLTSLRDTIREIVACFPVYRTYIDAIHGSIESRDKRIIDAAVREAMRRTPAMGSEVFDFVRDILTLGYPPEMGDEGRSQLRLFVMHFQQFTGPVMAKGMEDTAFYIYNPLMSLCDVGCSPDRIGGTVKEFHEANILRQKQAPLSLICTSTHDSKRGQDTRTRIDVISELPEEWRAAVRRWGRLNDAFRTITSDGIAPDRNEEYSIYQTLVGTYPTDKMSSHESRLYAGRIQEYVLKSLREAKVHTSWINPNSEYEQQVHTFVNQILNPSGPFLADFAELNKIVATCGSYNSLSQTVLKVFSPGIPDIYQGDELWSFNLADPDNRRPVDFEKRVDLLRRLAERHRTKGASHLASDLLRSDGDQPLKLYTLWRSLTYRRENAALFLQGSYKPLTGTGLARSHVCAFSRRYGGGEMIVVVPRLLAELTHNAAVLPLGIEVWRDSTLTTPRRRGKNYRNIFTEEILTVGSSAHPGLRLSDIFKTFPVAALELAAD